MTSGDLPRRGPRHPTRLEVEVTRVEGGTTSAMLSDLSLDGCCLEGFYSIGEKLDIKIPRIGTMKGQVRWSIFRKSGVRFIRD